MNTEQTNAKRHGPSRVTTVICLMLVLATALIIARMVKFRSQVDVTLPAVLWEDGETTAVNTTLHFHGELVKQWEDQPFTSEESSKAWLTMAREDGGLNRGQLYYGAFPANDLFGELYTDRAYEQFFLFPYVRTPGEGDALSSLGSGDSVYVAPAESLDEAMALLEEHGLLMPDGSLR